MTRMIQIATLTALCAIRAKLRHRQRDDERVRAYVGERLKNNLLLPQGAADISGIDHDEVKVRAQGAAGHPGWAY